MAKHELSRAKQHRPGATGFLLLVGERVADDAAAQFPLRGPLGVLFAEMLAREWHEMRAVCPLRYFCASSRANRCRNSPRGPNARGGTMRRTLGPRSPLNEEPPPEQLVTP